jgi:hypothetical protein
MKNNLMTLSFYQVLKYKCGKVGLCVLGTGVNEN